MISLLREFPLYQCLVGAGATGFPSPADDSLESTLDINEYLRLNKDATFYCKCIGDSMKPTLEEGDILVVDRSIKPTDGSIIICLFNSELLVKQLQVEFGKATLLSLNPKYPPLQFEEDSSELIIWGVVKSVVKELIKPKAGVRNRRW